MLRIEFSIEVRYFFKKTNSISTCCIIIYVVYFWIFYNLFLYLHMNKILFLIKILLSPTKKTGIFFQDELLSVLKFSKVFLY